MPLPESRTMAHTSHADIELTIRVPAEKPRAPTTFEFTREHYIEALASLLSAMVASTADIPKTRTLFHAKRAPKVSLYKYISRIVEYTKCSENCLLMALIYIDRISQKDKSFNLDALNVHRYHLTFNAFLLTIT